MSDTETTKELQVLDEMGKEVRQLTKFEQTVEDLKGIVAESSKITVDNLEDENQIALAKAKRIELRKIEIAIEKRGKGYRDVFNAVNKEIMGKEKELKAITSPEIERLTKLEEEAEALALKKKREALMPARKERLMQVDPSGCYICADEYLLEMDADAFEKYLNGCVANKNERNRIIAEEDAEKKREAERKAIEEERAKLEADKRAEEERKEKERQEAEAKAKAEQEAKEKAERETYEKEQERRKALLPERKEALKAIGDTVPMLEDRLMLAMDDNEYTTYYNNRVTAKNLADKKAIEDAKKAEEEARLAKEKAEADAKAEKERKEAEEKAEAERIKKEEEARKAEMEKKEAYKAFLKKHGYTIETRDQFETRETTEGYELWKKVGVFTK